MSVLVIHLSDMHLTTTASLPRAKEIAHAAVSQLANVNAIYVAISGDITNRGAKSEFQVAEEFCLELSRYLENQSGIRPSFVFCAGNHDCDFSGEQEIREVVLNSVQQKTSALTPALAQALSVPLKNYFEFQDRLSPSTTKINSWISRLDCLDHGIVFLSINSSVGSRIKESPGTLIVPEFRIEGLEKFRRVIYLMHHPYNWLTPENARELAQYAAASGDLFLMGHEHVEWAQTVTELYQARSITYLKAQVLKESGEDFNSGFQTIQISLSEGFLPRTYLWNGSCYALKNSPSENDYISWPSQAAAHSLALSESGYHWLSAVGANFTHRLKASLSLADVFVWPELRSSDRDARAETMTDSYRVDAEELVNHIHELPRIVIIKGAEVSGKSSLARMMALTFAKKNLYPIVLEASKISSWRERSLNERLNDGVEFFFGRSAIDKYRQTDKEQKVLLLDDFDFATVNSGYFDGLLALRGHFGRIFIFVDANPGVEIALSELLGDERFGEIGAYELLSTSFSRRLELIEKWLLIGDSRNQTLEKVKLTAAKWAKVVDETLGRNLIPSVPFFVLVILQRAETQGDLDTLARSGSHGFLYESLIYQSLTKHVSEWAVRTSLTYLASFAGLLFQQELEFLSASEFDRFHVGHCEQHDLGTSVARIQNQLSEAGIIDLTDGVRFKYPYHYYYFVAKYLTSIPSNQLEGVVDEMIRTLHTERSANILLFLAHLGNNPKIAQKVFDRAKSCFPSFADADLFNQNKVMQHFGINEVREILKVGTLRQQLDFHAAINSEIDSVIESQMRLERISHEERLKSRVSDVLSLNTVFKALQVLGQLLRNHAGDMRKEERRRLAEQCVSLGLRALSFIMETAVEQRDVFVEFYSLQIKSQKKYASDPEIAKAVNECLSNLIANMTVGVLIKIANAIGSEELELTLDNVLSESKTHKLIGLITRLEHFSEIPHKGIMEYKNKSIRESDVLPFAVLRRFLVRRFYLFPCRDELRRGLCSEMKIKIEAFAALPQKRIENKH